MWFWIIVIAVVGLAVFVRVAPSDPARWHREIKGVAAKDLPGAALRIVPGDLSRFDEIAQSAGAQRLAGSAQEGRITYIARSRIWGFPDYITAEQRGDQLAVYGRLRFGKSDLGVNRRRIEAWLAQL